MPLHIAVLSQMARAAHCTAATQLNACQSPTPVGPIAPACSLSCPQDARRLLAEQRDLQFALTEAKEKVEAAEAAQREEQVRQGCVTVLLPLLLLQGAAAGCRCCRRMQHVRGSWGGAACIASLCGLASISLSVRTTCAAA